MPNYAALRAQGSYNLPNGVSVFAGTVADPFFIDLGAAFDSLNFRMATGAGEARRAGKARTADEVERGSPESAELKALGKLGAFAFLGAGSKLRPKRHLPRL